DVCSSDLGRSVLVAERTAGKRGRDPHPGGQVRRTDPLPHRQRRLQRIERLLRLAPRQEHRPSRVGSDGREHLRLELLGELLQLAARLRRALEVPGREGDLHHRRQESRPLERLGRAPHPPPHPTPSPPPPPPPPPPHPP